MSLRYDAVCSANVGARHAEPAGTPWRAPTRSFGIALLAGLLIVSTGLGADVTNQALLDAQGDPESWLTYGRNYSGWRYSELDEINNQFQ